MADKDIIITYETLFDLSRIERSGEDLQKIDSNFFRDVASYLKGKIEGFEEQKHKSDLFSVTEADKTQKELLNIKRILVELYERREKKIIAMAINKSRTKSSIIDTSNLLDDEKRMYEQFVFLLDNFRDGVILSLIQGKVPEIKHDKLKEDETEEEGKIKTIRFLEPVERFFGKDLEVFGPFEEEAVANIPTELADVLVTNGKAENIEES